MKEDPKTTRVRNCHGKEAENYRGDQNSHKVVESEEEGEYCGDLVLLLDFYKPLQSCLINKRVAKKPFDQPLGSPLNLIL